MTDSDPGGSARRDAAMPLVSVGIPVRNGERFIREAVQSVLEQAGVRLELVISDNASTDATQAVCEELARQDPRIRYHRNHEDLGLSGNFRQVAALAQGAYFTWLAHDDRLGVPDYLAAIVGFMEEHRDVVLCGSTMRAFDEESPQDARDRVLDALRPERDWRAARSELFRWPQPESHWVLYGVYRRDVLLQLPLDGRTHRGRPVAMDVEYPILATLCRYGRIVALPGVVRHSRSVASSAACREMERFTALDYFWLALRMKLALVAIAVRTPLPPGEKLALLATVLGNFGRAHLGQRPRFTQALRSLRREAAVLRAACDERLQLIERLDRDLRAQRELVEALRRQLAEARPARRP